MKCAISTYCHVNHLKTCEQSLREGVESTPLHLSLVKVEFASEQLHAQQCEDDEEEEEQEQKGADSFHGVEQRVDQVGQSGPVPGNNKEKHRHTSDIKKKEKNADRFLSLVRSSLQPTEKLQTPFYTSVTESS